MKSHIYGAKWWKFEFHAHTPASEDHRSNLEDNDDISPKDWLVKYMREGIDCVAITDHNTGLWVDKLKRTYRELEENKHEDFRELYLFPGVEISASNNIHILGLFDITQGTADITALLGNLGLPTQDFGTTNSVSSDPSEKVIEKIHDRGGIAIPAHVDKECGLFESESGNTLRQALTNNKILALELIDQDYDKPEIYKQAKLNLTEVIGSDAHNLDAVGTNYTWIKMDEPSLDSLKLALHDGEDGVLRNDSTVKMPNDIKGRYFVKSLNVSNAFKAGNGEPLNSKFSPWLTSIIGGRGTGKSSLLNFLRIVFDKTDEMPEEIQEDFDSFNKIGRRNSSGMLRKETKITAEVIKDNRLHLLSWENGERSLKIWNDEDNLWGEKKNITNIKELFPVQVFSQKELFELTKSPSYLIELIDSQFDKKGWKEERDKLTENWLDSRAKERSLINEIMEEENLKAGLDAVNNKIELYEESDYKQVLNEFNRYKKIEKFFNKNAEEIGDFFKGIFGLGDELPVIDDEIDLEEETERFIESFNETLNDIHQRLEAIDQILDEYIGTGEEPDFKEGLLTEFKELSWSTEYEKIKEEYQEIREDLEESDGKSYDELIERKNELSDRLDDIEDKKDELQTTEKLLDFYYDGIVRKEKELRKKRNEVIEKWRNLDDSDNPFMQIELEPMGNPREAEKSFRRLIRKEGNEFAIYIYNYNEATDTSEGCIAELINEDKEKRWKKREDIVRDFLEATESKNNGYDVRLIRQKDSLYENTPEDIDRLCIWFPEDKLNLKFKKEGEFQNIETGSAGERSAAMLGLLLALNEIPLIIDQPEDDLDSRLISNFVVSGFKKLKTNRQLIIITHNPNIAVNANSDNIVYMDFTNGQISVQGNNALQEKSIREAVCSVMEGGKKALDQRYYRISKALS